MAKLKTAQIEELTQPEEAQPAMTPRPRKPKIVKSDQDEVAQAVEAAHQIVNTPRTTTCKVEGCQGKRYWSGYCTRHSYHYRKYGDPLHEPQVRAADPSAKLERYAEALRQAGWTVAPPRTADELVTG